MDYNKYIGLPYKDNGRDESGIDCWGLVRLFYKQEYDVELPSYTEGYVGREDPKLASLLELYKNDNWTKVTTPEPGCAILFNIMGQPTHIGIYLGGDKFLHSRGGLDSVIESTTSGKWAKRIEGYYKHTPVMQANVIGSAHPLKAKLISECVKDGSTLQEIFDGIKEKYDINDKLVDTVVIMLDGVVIHKDFWGTTTVKAGQQVAYKFVPKGDGAKRMLILIAVVVIALNFGPEWGKAAAETAGFGSAAQWTTAINMGLMQAGMALTNALVPIRPPQDPGTAKGLNLFNGASNQVNRFGAIPVVLGTVRMTAMLGAQPYVETATDTSINNLMLVWGFGPLQIEDLQVGSKKIEDLYDESNVDNQPFYVTYSGFAGTSADIVDSKYPVDIEQIYPNVQIVNTIEDPNDGSYIASLMNKCEDIDIALTFPEGMRSIDTGNGSVHPAEAHIEIQVREKDANGDPIGSWNDVASYGLGTYNSGNYNSVATSVDLLGSSLAYTMYSGGDSGDISVNTQLYRWHVLAIAGGELRVFTGAAFDNANGTISSELQNRYKTGSYASLTGETTKDYAVYPQIPANYLKLYSIKMFGNERVAADQQNHLSSYPGVQGFQLSYQPLTSSANTSWDEYPTAIGVRVSITSGLIANSSQTAPGVVQPIFNSRQFSNTATRNVHGSFLQSYGVWNTNAADTTFDRSTTVNFPHTGYYIVEASGDDYGNAYIDGVSVVDVPQGSWNGSVKMSVYVTAGNHTVRLKVSDWGGAQTAGLNITYTANEGLNAPSTNKTRIVFGAEGFFYKRKDAFNYVHRIRGLSRGYYDIKVTRTNTSDSEPEGSNRRAYYNSTLFSIVGYDKHNDDGSVKKIIKEPVGAPIARTYVRVQSTNKVNGTVDGINALVKSVVYDWDAGSNQWKLQASNNPASLFLHILSHPANAYRIPVGDLTSKVDLQAFKDWHAFCKTGISGTPLTFNHVITSTTSIMDVLRDIAAAGKASPAYVDGKWTVVIDRPKTTAVQHFTPHNSWGFEASKGLPRIPDAFRVSFINEQKAYQPDEFFVYKDPSKQSTARIFEEVQLPGVTRYSQAKHLAQWHMAQLILRPETYTINVDFEYLICTRGDLVRVTHDIPKWGTGSGRLLSATNGASTIKLSESFALEAGTNYVLRVRTETGASVTLALAPHTTGFYETVNLASPLNTSNGVKVGDLFMLGEVGIETQQLIVLSVEPLDGLSARLTLCDYSPEIYTTNFDSGYPAFNPNISNTNSDIATNGIYVSPEIVSFSSDSPQSEEISNGVYQNVLQISFANNATAGKNAQKIQFQIIPGDELFDGNSMQSVYEIVKEAGYARVLGLITGGVYKVRARYRNNAGTVTGPWSQTYTVTNIGKDTNYSQSPALSLDLDTTYIVAKPTYVQKQADFAAYEYRLFKDTGTEDFWELDVVANNIKVVRTSQDARFDLRDQPAPRISTEGITYRIACRSVDRSNNYSDTSTLGTIVVKTIQ